MVPTNSYYLHRADDSSWEEVDEFIYNNWHLAVLADGTERYSGNRVTRISGQISIFAENMSPKNYAAIMRLMGIKEHDCNAQSGYLRKPDSVELKKKRGKGTILKAVNGKIYKEAS